MAQLKNTKKMEGLLPALLLLKLLVKLPLTLRAEVDLKV